MPTRGALVLLACLAIAACGDTEDSARISGRQPAQAVAAGGDVLLPVLRDDCTLVIARVDGRTGRARRQTVLGKDAFDGWCPGSVDVFASAGSGLVLTGGVSQERGLLDKESVGRPMAVRLDARGMPDDTFGERGVRLYEDRDATGELTLLGDGAAVSANGEVVDERSRVRELERWSPYDADPIAVPTADGGAILAAKGDGQRIVVRRLRRDGRDEPGFGDLGLSRPGPRGSPLAIVPRRDGGALLSYVPASDDYGDALIALSTDGRRDRRFDRGASAEIGSRPLAEAPDGTLVAASLAEDHARLLATRYDERGRGLARVGVTLPRQLFPSDPTEYVSGSVVIDSGGGVTAVFAEARSARLAIVRLRPDLKIAPRFGRGGVVVLERL
jgi:hypothetical protein